MAVLSPESAGHSAWPGMGVFLVLAVPLLLGLAGLGVVMPLQVLDGTYQTFGMLDRLVHGDLPGVDQVPYLGVLLCYALGLLFVLFGRTIFAAYAASQLAVMVAWFACLWLLAWACGRQRSAARRFAALLFLATFAVHLLIKLTPGVALDADPFLFAFEPGVSMIYLREAASILAVAATAWITDAHRRRQALAAAAGVLLFWSPAAGLATLLVTGATIMAGEIAERRSSRSFLVRSAGYLAIVCLAAAAASTVLSGGHPVRLFNKIFLDTGGNQFWFFATFRDGSRLLRVSDLFALVSPHGPASAVLVAALVVTSTIQWRRSSPFSARADAIVLIAGSQFLSGLISGAGGHFAPQYLMPFICSAGVIPIIWCWDKVVARGMVHSYGGSVRRAVLVAFVLVDTVLLVFWSGTGTIKFRRPVWVAEAGMAFPATARGEIDYLRRLRADMDRRGVPPRSRIMSTYYAWPNVMLNAAPHPRFNSIIHLMTQADHMEFADYLRRTRPEIVGTLDWRSTRGWELWNVRAGWPFYRAVLADYRPVASGTQYVYWTRREHSAATAGAVLPQCRVRQVSPGSVELAFTGPIEGIAGGAGFIDVMLGYLAEPGRPGLNGDLGLGYVRVDDQSSGLRDLRARYYPQGKGMTPELKSPQGVWYGLPTGRRHFAIPVEHDGRHVSRLLLETKGGTGARLRVEECRSTALLPDPYAAAAPLPAIAPPFLF